MVSADEALQGIKGLERIQHIPGSTFKDNSTIIIVPTRGIERHTREAACEKGDHAQCLMPVFQRKVVECWQNLISPMNQKRAFIYCSGNEVGKSYDAMVSNILNDPNLSKWKYILTLEDDNIVPADTHIRLLESIEFGPFDAVSGIYFTKGDINMPMAFGDPEHYRKTGEMEFRPRNIGDNLARGENLIEVNGIAMGVALWRLDLFRSMPQPWFVTVSDIIPGKGSNSFTQDLYFCNHARKCGKRFAVDLRVKAGHMDVNTGIIY